MTVALIIISDGRDDCHAQCIDSACWALPVDEFDQIITVDDRAHELGFCGAIARAWEQVTTDWVFHLEADFTFHKPVPVDRMIGVLERHPHLAQLVLKRQAWNDDERRAGGIVEQHPGDYAERWDHGGVWTEHRRFWSTNPCLYSSRYCRLGWPQEPHSEGIFTHLLLADPLLRFAFWGPRLAPPLVEHIGVRCGTGY